MLSKLMRWSRRDPKNNKTQILIDAIHINNGGGLVLLDELIKKTAWSDRADYFFLLDERIKSRDLKFGNCRVEYLRASIISRLIFYTYYGNKFRSVLCFGNLPPPIRLKARTSTYFHQRLYLDESLSTGFKNRVLIRIKFFFCKNNIKEYGFLDRANSVYG